MIAAGAQQALRAWTSLEPAATHRAAAAAVLRDSDAADDGQAEAMLVQALWKACPRLVVTLVPALEVCQDGTCEVRENRGLLTMDAVLADWIAPLHPERAACMRDHARQRMVNYQNGTSSIAALFVLWTDGAAGALKAAARTLWLASVQAAWAETRHVRPALSRAVAVDVLAPAMTERAQVMDNGEVRDTGGCELGRIAAVDVDTLEAVRADLSLLSSLAGQRLVRYLVLTVHDAWQDGGVADPRSVEFRGGFQALARAIGDGTNDSKRLQALLRAGQHVHWTHPVVDVGGLWTWTHRHSEPGRPAVLRIVVGDALAPAMAARLADSGGSRWAARRARSLVPELRAEPPMSAVRDCDRAAAWMLLRLFVVELVDNARILAAEGSVPISEDRWRDLAALARLPRVELAALLRSWKTGDRAAKPLVVEKPQNHFTLSDAHSPELEFILEGGRQRIAGAVGGRKGKRKKRMGNHL